MKESLPSLRLAHLVFALIPISATLVSAQDQPTLVRGDFVRVTGVTEFQFRGTFLARDDTVLYLQREAQGDSTMIPIGRIERVERRVARKAQTGKGALVGAGVGGVLGLAVLMGSFPQDDEGINIPENQSALPILMAAGTAIGAIIDAASHKNIWATVPEEGWRTTAPNGP